jgi:Flp pilus assembly protein TadG
MKLKRLLDDTAGGAIVEFSVTLAFFLALTFGLVQAGLLLFTQSGLQHGVESAARCASVNYSAWQMNLDTSCFTNPVSGTPTPSTVIADTTYNYIKQYAIGHSWGLVDLATFTVVPTFPPGGASACPTDGTIGYKVTATAPYNIINYIFSVTLTATSKFPVNCS